VSIESREITCACQCPRARAAMDSLEPFTECALRIGQRGDVERRLQQHEDAHDGFRRRFV